MRNDAQNDSLPEARQIDHCLYIYKSPLVHEINPLAYSCYSSILTNKHQSSLLTHSFDDCLLNPRSLLSFLDVRLPRHLPVITMPSVMFCWLGA